MKEENWEFINSPNYWKGRKKPCSVLVYHYTAGGSANSCVKYFQKKDGVSAHFVIDRDGRIIQMVNLSDRSWHAGVSTWKEEKNVNLFSVGIEICNWGILEKKDKKYFCWPNSYNLQYSGETPFKDNIGRYWEKYPEEQINSVVKITKFILETFPQISLDNIVGHEHISPGRKTDPGPAFPWDRVKSEITKDIEPIKKEVTKTKKSNEKIISKQTEVENIDDEKLMEQLKDRSTDRKGYRYEIVEILSSLFMSFVKIFKKRKNQF